MGESAIFLNGEIVSGDRAKVSVLDRGFLYGDGVFETMRTYGGKIFHLEDHLDRLFRSANLLQLGLPWTRSWLESSIKSTLAANAPGEDVLIRLTVSRGVGRDGLDPPKNAEPTIVIAVRPLPEIGEVAFKNGRKAAIVSTRRNSIESLNPAAKTLNFLNNILAKIEARKLSADEAIMLNGDGKVTEATVGNIFCVKNKLLSTPPDADGILPGVTRKIVAELAAANDIRCEEKSLWPDDLLGADELFLTMTSVGIMPITAIDGLVVGTGEAGAITRKLHELFIEHVLKAFSG